MDNLIPHYSKEARSCLIDEIYDPVPDYKVIAADDLRDAVKLAQFFNVTHEYLLQSFMFPDNCEISNCMKFMEESRSLGYTTIVNCVVFCGKTADKDLICGLQVFIALKPDQEDVFFPILEKHKTDVEPRYQLPAEGTLRTFPNFKGVLETPYSQFFKYLFHAQQYTSQLHLFLGKNKKTEIPTHLTLESSKVECLLIGRQLLAFLNERLNTAFKTTELEKQIDDIEFVIVGKSFGEVKTSSSACKGSVVVNGVAEKLPPFLTSLTETTNPLEIKEIETSVAKLLTIVMHYCYFSKEPEVFRKVLAGVLSKVEELDFKMDSDLWCISNGENVAKIGSPVIRVRRSKVEAFKAAIGEQKAGLFPIVIVPDADNEADYMLDLGKPGESSVLKFAHGSAGPIEDVKFTIPFCGHCLCNPRETPSRLCKTCQMVLFLTTRGDIRCACTVYNRAELKCSETCEKNIWIPRTYQVLIVGSSAVGKSSLLNIISCMQQHSAVDANGEMTTIKDCANCVIDYNTHSIRYISKDELVIEESEIHGLMIVVENSTLELSYAADNLIRETISRLPRRVVKNCCIVNMFTQTETFGINEAQQQMHEFVTTFCDQHALSVLPSFICVDTVANMNQSTDNSKVCQGSFESSKRDIEKFLKTVQTIKPITPADLTVADNWKSLCAAFRPHYQKRDAEALRLMATIAKNCLTGVAIYCRKNLPLREDEWLAVVNHWSSKDKKVAAALRHLNSETR